MEPHHADTRGSTRGTNHLSQTRKSSGFAILFLVIILLLPMISGTGGAGMNFATINTRGPATSLHNLFGVNSTIYCTGVTSVGMRIRSATPRIQLAFLYKINDQNVTGQIINIIPEITTNASLVKTFSVGACDRCGGNLNCPHGTVSFDAYTQLQPQYFPVLNTYFATIGVQTGPNNPATFGPSGVTVYAYLDIQAITTDVKIAVSSNIQPPTLSMVELV